jgi:gamma-glutamyltranspeptidase
MRGWVSILFWSVSSLLLLGLAIGSPGEHARVFANEAVAADHYDASKAGAEVLAAGGNAADAAAATMLALGVVNPASSGLGGGGFALYYDAATGELSFLDFRERAPRASSGTMFEDSGQRPEGPANAPSQLGARSSRPRSAWPRTVFK